MPVIKFVRQFCLDQTITFLQFLSFYYKDRFLNISFFD